MSKIGVGLADKVSPLSTLLSVISVKQDIGFFNINRFFCLGKAPKGRYHIGMLYNVPLGDELYVFSDAPFSYASYCVEYVLTEKGGTPIGVLYDVDARRADFNELRLYVGNTKDVPTKVMPFPVSNDNERVYVYASDSGVLLIPTSVEDAPFIVLDEKD